jgi:hypothetical protein
MGMTVSQAMGKLTAFIQATKIMANQKLKCCW